MSFDFGAPADRSEADREIELVAEGPFAFQPDDLQVELGETITFVIRNVDSQEHEFILGDRPYQDEHSASTSGGHAHGSNGVHLPPGETAELTWRFSRAGEVLYGCHVAGHYEAGMVGRIEVS